MAAETKTAYMTNTGSWSGQFTVVIDNDAANAKVKVTATMMVYETWGATPREGDYIFYMYLKKDGVNVATAGSTSNTVYTWVTDMAAGGYKLTCSATFSYTDSCQITVGGWAIAYSGSLNGSSIEGTASWTVEAHRPPTEIVTDKTNVQMGDKLLFTLNRAYGTYTHSLYYSFGSLSDQAIGSGVDTSYVWTVPDLAVHCNNATDGICTLKCVTYQGSTKIGTTTKTITLTVQDPTTPSITGGKVTLGKACSITCKRNSSNFKVKLEFEFKNTTVTIGTVSADSRSWTPSYDLAKLIPALTSGTGTLKCTTYNGTAKVGTKSVTITVIVPENDTTRPSFTADGLKLTPISSLPEAFAGMYMRGKTGLKAEFTATSNYSTITEYSLIIGNQSATGNPATIDLLVSEGDVKVTGKVTDARGFSTSVSVTITVMAYRNPKVTPHTGFSDVICERAKETGQLSADGTYLAIKAGKSFSSVVLDGVEMNSCALHYRWKPNGVDAYSEWITLLADGSAETEISLLVGNVVSSLQKSYMVEIEAVDALEGRHKLTFQIMTEAISFVLYDGPDGAGFGKYPEEPHVVDIASHMTLLVRGKLTVLGNDWVSIGLADLIGESGYNYGRKETGCFYLVTEGRHVHIAFNCMYVYAGTAVIVNATPIPEENRPARPVFSLCPANDRQIACVSVGTDGYIRVEWVQKATDTVLTGNSDVTWLDGYLCYWT